MNLKNKQIKAVKYDSPQKPTTEIRLDKIIMIDLTL